MFLQTLHRIPVGYWYWDVEDGEPFPAPNLNDTDVSSPLFYLKRAIKWMDELGLQALIDLHAGPGSQNGYDNSGRRGEVHWVDETYPENRANLERTLRINEKIAQTMRDWSEMENDWRKRVRLRWCCGWTLDEY